MRLKYHHHYEHEQIKKKEAKAYDDQHLFEAKVEHIPLLPLFWASLFDTLTFPPIKKVVKVEFGRYDDNVHTDCSVAASLPPSRRLAPTLHEDDNYITVAWQFICHTIG